MMTNGPREQKYFPPLAILDGTIADDPVDKANAFFDQFCPTHENPAESESPDLITRQIQEGILRHEPHMLNQDFTITELDTCLNDITDKAMGLDNIHNRMLKNLNPQNRQSLLLLLNLLFRCGFVPSEWKRALVIPIPKPNKPRHKAESYRPISLTSCLGKIMERMINNRLKWFLDNNRKIPNYQTGFRRGCTKMDNLVRLEADVKTAFNNKKSLTAIFLDIAKAYDSA